MYALRGGNVCTGFSLSLKKDGVTKVTPSFESAQFFKLYCLVNTAYSDMSLVCLYFFSSFSSAASFRLMHSTSMAFSSSSTGGRLGAMRRLASSGSFW